MSFESPQFLWAALLLPLLWWLSQPPRPRRQVLTPHLAQWQQALHALRRRPPRGSAWRFVLLALATLAAAIAAARPVARGRPGPRRLVVLLDASASMALRGVDGVTAFDAAKARLRAAFAVLPPHVEVTLLRCGGALLRRHGASARALQDLGEPDGELAVDLSAIAAAAAAAPDTAVWTLTDGQGQARLPDVGALTSLGDRDERTANAAVLALRIDDQWPLPVLPVDIDVVAFAPAAPGGGVPVTLTAAGAIAPLPPAAHTLQPGVVATIPLVLERTAAGGELRIAAALAGDRLPDDDALALTLPPLPAPRIAVLAEPDGGPYAEAAAEALAVEVGGDAVAAAAGQEVGLLLVDGGAAAVAPGSVRAVTFGTRLEGAPAPEPWPQPTVADWARGDAWTAGLDLSELVVERAWGGILPPGEPFLWAEQAGERRPLAVVARGAGGVASVHFAFRLRDGNLPLLAAFPQLLRRAFVQSYGAAAAAVGPRRAPPPGEVDLGRGATAADRPLPTFATPDQDLAAWFVLLGLGALALRTLVR